MGSIRAVLLNDTSSKHHYGCRLVVDQIRAHCAAAGIDLHHCVKVGEDWRSPEHVARVASTQMLIVNGEGTLHDSREKVMRLVSSAHFCRDRNIKSFLINSVYQDNSDEIADSVRLFDLIFVRESRSQAALAAQGISARIVPDMSLSLVIPASNGAGERSGVIFCDSVDMGVASYLYEVSKRTENSRFVTLVPADKEPIRHSKAWKKMFLSGRKEDEVRRQECWPPFQQPTHGTLGDLFDLLVRSQLIVTGRFHMICLALLTRTPFVALPSNTHKIEGLLDDVGLPHRFISRPNVPQGLLEYSQWHEGEPERVEAYVDRARRSIEAMFSTMRSSLS